MVLPTLFGSPKRTDYLIDPQNHTGYAQVLQETEYDITAPANPVPLNRMDYALGDDVISQTKSTWNNGTGTWVAADTQYLLYDGHGSTRQLARPDKSVIESYSYDGYGTMLGDAANAQTNLLYCGEQYDKNLLQYYLRARYYNPLNGLFNQMDPYAGNMQDPQSLHKYLYAHCNPVNNIDPSGLFSLGEMLLVSVCIGAISMSVANIVTTVQGKTQEEINQVQWKWFWRGFVIGAVIYGVIWASYLLYLAIFSGAGFGGLKFAEQYGIRSYDELTDLLKGTGLQAHHIIPQRFAQLLGLDIGDMLSVAVQYPAEHPIFTNMWRQLIPYGTINVTKEQIWEAAKIVYAEYPALLEAAKIQLMMAGG